MNNKLFFYVYVLIVTFLAVNIYKHISTGAPASDYLIYGIIALTLLSNVVDELIELVYGRRHLIISIIFKFILYISILLLSIYGITISTSLFDTVLYAVFIPASLLLMYVQFMAYKKNINQTK
ncbi:hypothetical protein ACMGE6_02305 [Macrococcus equi]|uniref:hypothetical protein n=1 Tax=Macrococcus equi TaxID=3395462 RepID=UPI0039BDFFFB